VLRFELPPPSTDGPNIFERTKSAIRAWFNRGDLPIYRELGPEGGKGYQEVAQSLDGQKSSMVRVNERGAVIVSVAVPVQHLPRGAGRADAHDPGCRHRPDVGRRAVGDPESRRRRRRRHDRVVRCCWPAPSQAPVRRLADSAERSAAASAPAWKSLTLPGVATKSAICPGALRDMTDALYNRIEAIEMFAADVAHELKNPLTSMRFGGGDAAAGAQRT